MKRVRETTWRARPATRTFWPDLELDEEEEDARALPMAWRRMDMASAARKERVYCLGVRRELWGP